MQKLVLALAALAIAMPAQAQAPKAQAVQDAYKAGFKDCAASMEKFVAFVHEEEEGYAYFSLWSTEKANESVASAVTVQTFTDGQGVASITATKNGQGGCDVVLTHTLAIPDQTCDEMRKTTFKDWKLWSRMDPATVHEDPTTPNGHAVLSPLGKSGCLVVKHLVGYGV